MTGVPVRAGLERRSKKRDGRAMRRSAMRRDAIDRMPLSAVFVGASITDATRQE
ncbi:MAG: hypothetical protein U1E56_01730 [Bauldia sp.]